MEAAFLLRERVFRARLRNTLEPVDFVLKKLARECLQSTRANNPRALFGFLKDWKNKFWDEHFPSAMAIIMEWANRASNILGKRRPMVFFAEDLKVKIWNTLLQRLSLDSWLILEFSPSSKHMVQPLSQGNMVLEITMRVINDVIYSQFPLLDDSSGLADQKLPAAHVARPDDRVVHRHAKVVDHRPLVGAEQKGDRGQLSRPRARQQFQTLFETPVPMSDSSAPTAPMPTIAENPTAEPHQVLNFSSPSPSAAVAPPLQPSGHEADYALLRNSTRSTFLPSQIPSNPSGEPMGMPVQLYRSRKKKPEGARGRGKKKEVSNKSRSRKKRSGRKRKNKKNKKKKRRADTDDSDSSDSDDDDDDDDGDSDDDGNTTDTTTGSRYGLDDSEDDNE